MPAFLAAPAATDARIEEIRIGFEDFRYRAPYKFGGKEVDRVTMLNVHCRLALKSGKSAEGFAAMSMGNVWSFPAPDIPYDTTLGAMKTLAEKIAGITRGFTEYAHPLDVNFALEPEYLKAAAETSREMRLPRPIPKLCTLVTASPLDAAIHDAFGRLHDRNAFTACGRDFVRYDLEHYLGRAEFHGEFLDPYILPKAVPRVRMYHSAGASDPLTAAEIRKPIRDGLPETLEDWIPYSGITAIKIKLNGNDLAWDVDRVAGIDAVATAAQAKRGVREWIYSLDFNERCPNVQYLLDFEHRLKSQIAHRVRPACNTSSSPPRATWRPTARTPCSKPPSCGPWSSTNRSPGWTCCCWRARWATPAPRSRPARASRTRSCWRPPRRSTRCSAACRTSPVPAPRWCIRWASPPTCRAPATVEANAREYVPAANAGWEKRFPGIFNVRDGYMDTAGLDGPGLCTGAPA